MTLRRPSSSRQMIGLLMLGTIFVPGALSADEGTNRRGIEFFEKKIRPVLVQNCYECHSAQAKKLEGELLLDSREGIRAGGETGPAVVPGDLEASVILEALRHDGLEMPPEKKLPESVLGDFETWIKMGAPDPRGEKLGDKQQAGAEKNLWSFVPPKRYQLPEVKNRDWIARRIDAFVLAKLESSDLNPAPRAERRTLIRRVTFDLTGLPPTPQEIEAFLSDRSPRAYSRLVDRLLASPHYGERWTRMWLDIARYAEDQAHIVGNNSALFYPNAYLYRDWLIGAFNRDMPYDRFVKLQLAGDMMPKVDESQHVALGFVGLGPKYYRRNAPEVMADEWADRVDTVSRGLLALTVACARCHDHKFDPIPTEDYYAMAGVFASTEMYNKPLPENNKKKPAQADPTKKGKQNKKKKKKQTPATSLHIIRDRKPRDLKVFLRGDVKNQGAVVKRQFLQILSPDGPKLFEHGSGRIDLAEAIVDPKNPLTARVIVNRVWAQLTGRPIVTTASNFGNLGAKPSHPKLLDDLAVRFIASGWSLKWLQREIVLSSTYQQKSQAEAEKVARDPGNRLLSHMNRRRLDVEWWRDSMLAASGRLQGTIGGKSIQPEKPAETRRTVYSRISRLQLNAMLAAFDYPDPGAHSAGRSQTTTPLQKLFVMNNPFMVYQADALVARLHQEIPSDTQHSDQQRIERAYLLLYGRPVRDDEAKLALSFLSFGDDRAENWRQYAQVLLSANELLFID